MLLLRQIAVPPLVFALRKQSVPLDKQPVLLYILLLVGLGKLALLPVRHSPGRVVAVLAESLPEQLHRLRVGASLWRPLTQLAFGQGLLWQRPRSPLLQ